MYFARTSRVNKSCNGQSILYSNARPSHPSYAGPADESPYAFITEVRALSVLCLRWSPCELPINVVLLKFGILYKESMSWATLAANVEWMISPRWRQTTPADFPGKLPQKYFCIKSERKYDSLSQERHLVKLCHLRDTLEKYLSSSPIVLIAACSELEREYATWLHACKGLHDIWNLFYLLEGNFKICFSGWWPWRKSHQTPTFFQEALHTNNFRGQLAFQWAFRC